VNLSLGTPVYDGTVIYPRAIVTKIQQNAYQSMMAFWLPWCIGPPTIERACGGQALVLHVRLSERFLVAKVKQLTVSLENKPGTLAHVTKILADAKVNILALFGSTVGEQGSAQLVVDNVNRAKKALSAAGVAHREGVLQQVELSNKPGAFAQFADKLAKKGVNIDSIYATAPKGAKKAVVVLATSGPLL
jgi:hypothetical protein